MFVDFSICFLINTYVRPGHFEGIFDGALGKMNSDTVEINLKSDAKPWSIG